MVLLSMVASAIFFFGWLAGQIAAELGYDPALSASASTTLAFCVVLATIAVATRDDQ